MGRIGEGSRIASQGAWSGMVDAGLECNREAAKHFEQQNDQIQLTF